MTSSHLFVSYSRSDQSFAFSLAAALKNAGVAIWIDQFEIVVGQDWRAELEKNLNTSSGCIVVISPDYVDSEYCRKELHRANELKLPIFPVLLRTVEPARWPLAMNHRGS